MDIAPLSFQTIKMGVTIAWLLGKDQEGDSKKNTPSLKSVFRDGVRSVHYRYQGEATTVFLNY